MSALAQYYLAKGHQVSGSDLVSSEITKALTKMGIPIYIGPHNPNNLCLKCHFKHCTPDLVVYSPAVKRNNPELTTAKKLKIKYLSYPEALGELTKKYFTIAVSGTHGKSTTAAMIALILIKAGLDPTVIIGTKLKEFGNSNFRMGESKYLVIEADEHFVSFLHYWPKMIVLTNIEKDHLDYYKNLENIIKAFREYVNHLPKNGVLVANGDDKNISNLKSQISSKHPDKSGASRQAKLPARHDFVRQGRARHFKIRNYSIEQKESKKLRKILKIPGGHNVSNALAALSSARGLGIPDRIAFQALSEYHGAWRRFEEKNLKIENPEGKQASYGTSCKLKMISDYAHHPTEIRATLQAAREKFPKKRIWATFQPHQYQRTYYFFDDFVRSFDLADYVIITDIYEVTGREEKRISKKVNAKKLAKEIKNYKKNTYYIKDFKEIPRFLIKKVTNGDIILVMGAGDIYQITDPKFWR